MLIFVHSSFRISIYIFSIFLEIVLLSGIFIIDRYKLKILLLKIGAKLKTFVKIKSLSISFHNNVYLTRETRRNLTKNYALTIEIYIFKQKILRTRGTQKYYIRVSFRSNIHSRMQVISYRSKYTGDIRARGRTGSPFLGTPWKIERVVTRCTCLHANDRAPCALAAHD